MLVQAALTVFALCAMLSLAVDLGYLRFTQGRMQIAADSAALEGLRNRNAQNGNAFASDCLRRAAANRVVRWTLDDNAWDTAAGAPAGADLQYNRENAAYGDMVSGQFSYTPTTGSPEDAAYARVDFSPSGSVPDPPAALPTCPEADDDPPNPWPAQLVPQNLGDASDNAFLVRLRRSNELQDFGAQTQPGVATSGAAVPYTFGKAALISGDPASTYSPARDGLTVRATAIAQSRPALRVGLPQTTPAMAGVTPFTVVDTFVSRLPNGAAPRTVTVNAANGFICDGTVTTCVAGTSIGRFVDSLTTASRARWLLVDTVGKALPGAMPVACAALRTLAAAPAGQTATIAGYGPIYAQLTSSGANRIVGFIRIRLTVPATCPALTPGGGRGSTVSTVFTVTMFRAAAGIVASSNATASLSGGLPLPINSSAAEVSEVLARNASATYGPLLVPVLSR